MKQTFKKSLSIILAAAMIICAVPVADFAGFDITGSVSEFFDSFAPKAEAAVSGTCGENVYWNLDEETGTLTISGNGEMDDMPNFRDNMFSDDPITPWDKDAIKRVIIEDGVTRIGKYAFSDHYELYEIQIPDSVTSIGEGVFQYCSSLMSLTLPGELTSIPAIMCSMADLRYIYIPAGITQINQGAFYETDLIEIEFGGTEEQWNNIIIKDGNDFTDVHMVFDGGIPLSETQSGNCGYNVTWKLTTDGTLTISGNGHMDSYASPPMGVIQVGHKYSNGSDHPWFEYRSKIKKIVITSGVVSVGEYAFFDCFNCTSLEIQDGVTTIKEGAFVYLPITSLSLPDSVSTLGMNAFKHCSALQEIEFSENITILNNGLFSDCKNLKAPVLPDGLTAINPSAFSRCEFDELVIPATVTSIGSSFAFVNTVHFLGPCPSFSYNEIPYEILQAKCCYCLPEYYESYKALFAESEAQCTLSDGPIRAKLNKKNITLTKAEPVYQLTVTDEKGYAATLTETWWVDKNEVASVDTNGVVTASGHGRTILFAEISADGYHSMTSCVVTTKRNDLLVGLLPDSIEADFPVSCQIGGNGFYNPGKLSETDTTNIYYQELLTLTNNLISGCSNDNQKAKAIWNWVSNNITYGGKIGIGTYADQAYAVYVDKKAHCEGFAKLTGFMLSLADIPSCLVTSPGHMWNIALLDGKWVMIDSTNKAFGKDYNDCASIEWIGFGTENFCFVIDNTEGIKLAGAGDHAIYDYRQDFTSLVVPDFVDIIFGYAFDYCTNLKNITLPKSIKKITTGAFGDCDNLTNVYYAGSEEQWSAITIADGNEPLLNANIYFNGETGPHEHSYTPSVTTPATCTENGVKTYACRCGNSYTETIFATGHRNISNWQTVIDATCKLEGKKVKICNDCDEEVAEESIPVKAHTPGEWETVQEPSCTVDGEKVIKCTVCGEETNSETISATGHTNIIWITNTPPTCSKAGMKQMHCLDCDAWLDYETIPKTEHTPADYWVNDTQPTCTTEGRKIKKCTVCGEAAEEQIIPANGHIPTGDWITETSPSCEGAGRKIKYCSVCKEIAKEILIDPTGHQSSTEWIIRKDATCTENGVHYKKCTVCGMDAEIKEIPALGHDIPSEWTVTKKATCTENGTKIRKCTRCDKTETEIIPATGHTDGAWIVTSDSDCINSGIKIKACTACGLKTASSVIPPKGHVSGEWEITERATCSKEGSRIKRCTRCNTVIQSESIPVTSHEKGNWIVIKAPSGGSYGIKAKFCIGCGIKMEEKIFHSVSNSVVKDNETGIEILYPDDSFDGTMSVDARIISGTEIGGAVYDEFGTCNFRGYEAILIDDGEAVTPSKSYSLKLPVPNGFNYKSAEVYAITSSGSFSKVTPTYENGCFTINNVDAVKYVIIEKIITLSLSETSLSMNKGNSVQLYVETNATGVTYTSSNPDVAVVDENGIVTAVGSGVAVITAKADGSDVKDECTVEVTQNFFEMIMAALAEAFSGFFKAITNLFKSLNGTLS